MQIKIGDFGSAVKISKKYENEGFTAWYKAPEIIMGDLNYSTSIDIWSFGCLYYELINGVPFFPGYNDFH